MTKTKILFGDVNKINPWLEDSHLMLDKIMKIVEREREREREIVLVIDLLTKKFSIFILFYALLIA